ncbi:MAG: hypothetical protein ACOC80_14265 [Petrotogales bacterium]
MIESEHTARETLPLGHIDRYKAVKALRNEYRCHKVEKFWNKKRGKSNKKIHKMSASEILQFCNKICDEFGYRRLKRIVIRSKEVYERENVGGFYRYNEIHVGYPSFTVILHELAHHFQKNVRFDGSHGKKFTIELSILNAVAHKIITGKDIKSDWIEKADNIINELFENDAVVKNWELSF